MMRLMKKREGFTLVELMVVVVIIGILIAIAIPIYGGIQARARNNACAANVRTITGAVAMLYSERGSLPDTLSVEDLTTAKEYVTDEPEYGPYLEDEPVCPWDQSTEYAIDVIDGATGEYEVTHEGTGHGECETEDGSG